MDKKLKIYLLKNFYGSDYKLAPVIEHYSSNGTLAIELWETKRGKLSEPFATLTVNLSKSKGKTKQYVDINNCPWALNFIETNELGKRTGDYDFSGYCIYPEYEFNLEKLNEMKEEGD